MTDRIETLQAKRTELLSERDAARQRIVSLDYPGHPTPWDAVWPDFDRTQEIMAEVDVIDAEIERIREARILPA